MCVKNIDRLINVHVIVDQWQHSVNECTLISWTCPLPWLTYYFPKAFWNNHVTVNKTVIQTAADEYHLRAPRGRSDAGETNRACFPLSFSWNFEEQWWNDTVKLHWKGVFRMFCTSAQATCSRPSVHLCSLQKSHPVSHVQRGTSVPRHGAQQLCLLLKKARWLLDQICSAETRRSENETGKGNQD